MEELIIKEQETREKLVQVINGSQLPACMLEPMVREIHEQLDRLKAQQYQEALANQEEQKKTKKKEVKDGQD